MNFSKYFKKKKWHLRDFLIPLIPVPLAVPISFLISNGFNFAFFLSLGIFLFIYLPLLIILIDKGGRK